MNEYFIRHEQELRGEILRDLIGRHYKENVGRYKKLYDLYKGEHDILDRKVSDVNKPNNKLVNNYFGKIVDDAVGYFLGKEIIISTGDEVQDEVNEIFNENDKDDLFMEVGKESAIKGKSAILVYQNEYSETKLTKLPAEEVIFVYDSSKTNEMIFAVRVYELDVVGSDGNIDKIKYAEVYDRDQITYYIEDDEGDFRLDVNRSVNPASHIFEEIPIVPFPNNEEEQGDFEKIISLVNDYDKVFSDASNEHEAFRNAYLMLKNLMMDDGDIAKLKQTGVFEVGEDGDIKFVTKDMQTDALENHLNRLEDNIHQLSQVPNLSDENFASNLSGVAIKFKLFGLENKCITKERKMTKAIKRLLKLISKPIEVKTGNKININDVEINFTRNLPNNVKELSEVVKNLNGTVDKETLLAILPFVDDPKEVIKRLKKEADVYASDLDSTGNFIGDEEE
ncbi:MAG: phage portal protein, SPP1 family [Candidatus Frackibacter sp. T328-2]|nr:MAG: phage portal protein, SPP1 family [Candidatus Frackibacter sp. T328-2]